MTTATQTTILPKDAFESRRNGTRARIIDVRTPAEFTSVHAEGAELAPIDGLNPAAVLRDAGRDQAVYLICKSGGRASRAREQFAAAGFENALTIEGGTDAWEKAGLPVVRGENTISLERQVRIAAGGLVLIGTGLGYFVHPIFFMVPAFVGSGLVFAGVTDWCGMGMLLAKMPWNR